MITLITYIVHLVVTTVYPSAIILPNIAISPGLPINILFRAIVPNIAIK